MAAQNLYPFSWSGLSDYRTCPKQYYHKRVIKDIPWVETPEIIWGNEVHKALELNCTDNKPLTGKFSFLVPMADKLNAIPGDHYAERKLAVNINLEPVDYWAKDAWARAINDRTIVNGGVGFTFDYKTGKRKPFSPQLSMATAITFAHHPEVENFWSAYLWTVGGKPTHKKIPRAEIPIIWAPIKDTLRDMEWSYEQNAWPAKPNGLCREWCPVLSCVHNGRRPRR